MSLLFFFIFILNFFDRHFLCIYLLPWRLVFFRKLILLCIFSQMAPTLIYIVPVLYLIVCVTGHIEGVVKDNIPRKWHVYKSNYAHSYSSSLTRDNSNRPTPEPEDDDTFCTLVNFQKCISEFLASSVGNSGHTSSSTVTSDEQSTSTNDLAFPTTVQQLQVTCKDLKERVRCLDSHSERCFTPQMLQVFGHIVTNAKQFVHDLCDNKRVQNGLCIMKWNLFLNYISIPPGTIEYLIHAKCFRNISLDEQKCGQMYRDAINIPVGDGGGGTGAEENGHDENHQFPGNMQQYQVKELIMRRSCWWAFFFQSSKFNGPSNVGQKLSIWKF